MNENGPWANVWITFCLFNNQKRWKTNASRMQLGFIRVQIIHAHITVDTLNFLLSCSESLLQADGRFKHFTYNVYKQVQSSNSPPPPPPPPTPPPPPPPAIHRSPFLQSKRSGQIRTNYCQLYNNLQLVCRSIKYVQLHLPPLFYTSYWRCA